MMRVLYTPLSKSPRYIQVTRVTTYTRIKRLSLIFLTFFINIIVV